MKILNGVTANAVHALACMGAFINYISPTEHTLCGCVRINENWAITAAHCVVGTYLDRRIFFGQSDVSDVRSNVSTPIVSSFVHPLYAPAHGGASHDVALLKLSSAPDSGSGFRLPFTDDYSAPGTILTIAGYGMRHEHEQEEEGGTDFSLLYEADVTVLDARDYPHLCVDEATELLAADFRDPKDPNDNVDSCYGDSGGPLFRQITEDEFMLVGIVSWGVGCGRDHYPGVYAKVFASMDWIRTIIE